jgi:lysophospholipase L1-like esterase
MSPAGAIVPTACRQNGGGIITPYFQKLINTVGAAYLLRYYQLYDLSGTAAVDKSTNLANGTYTGSPTLGEPGVIASAKSALFGANSYMNFYTAGLAAAYTPDEMTVGVFFKPPAGWWTDNAQHYLFNLDIDNNNCRRFYKTTSNVLGLTNLSNSVAKSIQATTFNSYNWTSFIATISRSNDRARLYVNGSPWAAGTTGLETYQGTLSSARALIANLNTTSHAYASLCWQSDFFLATRELTPAEVAIASNPWSGGVTNFLGIGDSKTANNPNWRTYVTDLMGANGKRWVSWPLTYSNGGWTTQNVKDGIDAYLASAVGTPNYIIANLGANDVAAGDPGVTWKTNTMYWISACHVKYPNAQVYLTKSWRRGTSQNIIDGEAAVNTYTDQILADPTYSSYTHIGVNEADFMPGSDDGATNTQDGIHPTSVGATLWAAAMKTVLGV